MEETIKIFKENIESIYKVVAWTSFNSGIFVIAMALLKEQRYFEAGGLFALVLFLLAASIIYGLSVLIYPLTIKRIEKKIFIPTISKKGKFSAAISFNGQLAFKTLPGFLYLVFGLAFHSFIIWMIKVLISVSDLACK